MILISLKTKNLYNINEYVETSHGRRVKNNASNHYDTFPRKERLWTSCGLKHNTQ